MRNSTSLRQLARSRKIPITVSVLVLMLGLIAVTGYIGIFHNDAPAGISYYGKPLTYWFKPWRNAIDMIQVSSDVIIPQPSRGDINPEAIPFLIKKLNYHQSPFNRLWSWGWRWLPLPTAKRVSWLQPVSEDVMRANARSLLRLSKYNAAVAVPVLAREYEKNDAAVRTVLADVLGEMGADARSALPVLRGSLSSQNAEERRAAEAAVVKIERRPGFK